jgi:hypothetical protein
MGERVNEVGCIGDATGAVPNAVAREKTAPVHARELGPAETSELHVRRCLRYASVLLAQVPTRPEQRLRLLGRSRYWLRTALLGLDRLAEEIDRSNSTADTLDLVLEVTTPASEPR